MPGRVAAGGGDQIAGEASRSFSSKRGAAEGPVGGRSPPPAQPPVGAAEKSNCSGRRWPEPKLQVRPI